MVRPPGVTAIVRPPQSYPKRIAVGPYILYPNYNPNPWGWNHGVIWAPSPAYWGGGFWGPYAYGLGFTYFGAVAYSGQSYDSYQVAVDSPGADLLEAYGLTQTPCGPPNLVVIWGTDGSVVCAFPNRLVAPGEYTIDPDTLTLVSVAPSPRP
jgi:hypothetical protein